MGTNEAILSIQNPRFFYQRRIADNALLPEKLSHAAVSPDTWIACVPTFDARRKP
jgi:hypothetical protein